MDTYQFERVKALGHRMFPSRRGNNVSNPKGSNQSFMALLLEEAGELAGATRTLYGRELRPDKHGSLEEVKGEIGDVMLTLVGICELHGVTPQECLEQVIQKCERRCEAAGR